MPTHLYASAEALIAHSTPEPNSGCWLWLGSVNAYGYGRIRRGNGRYTSPHRRLYELLRGEIGEGLYVCHRCDVPLCVNPDHLFLGTQTENMRDCANKRRIRVPTLSGEYHPSAKLGAKDVARIRTDDRPSRVVAKDYGVSHGTICYIRKGDTWK